MDKETFDKYDESGLFKTDNPDIDLLRRLGEKLIQVLYKPDKSTLLFKLDRDKVKGLGINPDEPVNWGSLNVCDVFFNSTHKVYHIIIEEASPGQCPTLCEYFASHFQAWGWDVVVNTEW